MTTKVTATFQGHNGSLDYQTDGTYKLQISQEGPENQIVIQEFPY